VFLLYVFLPNIINPMYIQNLREMVLSSSQNTVAICKQITLLILYYMSSRLVTIFKVTVAPIQAPDIFYLIVSSSSSILAFRYFFILFLKCLLASHLTLFR